MMIVNFKNYKWGDKAGEIVKLIKGYGKDVIVCLGSSDLDLAKGAGVEVFAQHVDYQKVGRSTGFLIPEILKDKEVKGSLLNHSEHPVSLDVIKRTLTRCRDLDLKVIVCVSSLKDAEKIRGLKPYGIAFENPKFIGTGKSITEYSSEEVLYFVKLIEGSGILPICGAGISSDKDYEKTLELGCKGVLLSSAVMKTKNPSKFLESVKKW